MNRIINILDIIGWFVSKSLWSFCLRLLCKLKGVRIGKSSSFYGFAKFKRARGSIINIGERLTLRSSSTSNLIGVNRPCIISTLSNSARLSIGDNCGFSGTVIGCFKEITFGNKVMIGANSLITDGDWHPDDPRAKDPRPVVIGNNVWLGVNVIVLKGVTIGENSLIGAGSVVTSNIPANVIAVGNPCKVIRPLLIPSSQNGII
jgi:acetyltransferase-like isoleucine patch superfamily enzyme